MLKICGAYASALAQSHNLKATCIDNDSIYDFSIHDRQLKRAPRDENIYYSFQNFQLISQTGARSHSYLHGSFENRSYTTNMLYAKGEFWYGLKHGEWHVWDRDGSLLRIEIWKKGKLLRRTDAKAPAPTPKSRGKKLLFWRRSRKTKDQAPDKREDPRPTDESKE